MPIGTSNESILKSQSIKLSKLPKFNLSGYIDIEIAKWLSQRLIRLNGSIILIKVLSAYQFIPVVNDI